MIWLLIIVAAAVLLLYKPEPKTESVLGVDSPIIPESETIDYDASVHYSPPLEVTNKPGGEAGVLGVESPILAQYSGGSNRAEQETEIAQLQYIE